VIKEEGEGANGLTVRSTFEPSRLSKDGLVLAYHRLVPIGRSNVRVGQNKEVEGLRQEGGYDHYSSHLRAS
jgi:hypothetical protein